MREIQFCIHRAGLLRVVAPNQSCLRGSPHRMQLWFVSIFEPKYESYIFRDIYIEYEK